MELNRLVDENEHQYIWRLCEAKENGLIDCDWKSLAEIFNKELCNDETDYKDESAYRKSYQYAKMYYEDVFKNKIESQEFLDDLTGKEESLKKERYKLLDARSDYNKKIRDLARLEDRLDYLEKMVKENSQMSLPKVDIERSESSDNDLLVILSDLHIGQTFDSFSGKYDSSIAGKRLSQYLGNIKRIKNINKCENCYLSLQGDLISNSIHKSISITNRENVIEQIMTACNYLSGFIYQLSLEFKNVYFSSVAGNHSRLDRKEDALKDERFDDLIAWYLDTATEHLKNVHRISSPDNTFSLMTIRGKDYVGVHGDYDDFSKNGAANLSMMLGKFPYAITFGHMHVCSMTEEGGIKLIRGGCFSGSGDDYTIQKRLVGKPSQMVCVCNKKGIESYHVIELD